VAHACNLSTLEAKAEESQVQSQPRAVSKKFLKPKFKKWRFILSQFWRPAF
jgi:hypothetical protein